MRWLALLLALVLVAGCKDNSLNGRLRVLVGTADLPAFDVYVDDELLVGAVEASTPYQRVTSKLLEVTLRPEGETRVLWSGAIRVDRQHTYTLWVYGDEEDLKAGFVEESLSPAEPGDCKFRLWHGGANPLDLYLTLGSDDLEDMDPMLTLEPGQRTDYFAIPVEGWRLRATRPGEKKILVSRSLSPNDGDLLTVLIFEQDDEETDTRIAALRIVKDNP